MGRILHECVRATAVSFLLTAGSFRRAGAWRGCEAARTCRETGGLARAAMRRGGGMRPTFRVAQENRCCTQPNARRTYPIRQVARGIRAEDNLLRAVIYPGGT